jgi:hypothetical protein
LPRPKRRDSSVACLKIFPRAEAEALAQLVRRGNFTVEQARDLISIETKDAQVLYQKFGRLVAAKAVQDRQRILRLFDQMVAQESR